MAYVVARPRGRFEIRESVHTAKGPRARSLANFADLTDDVLATARDRASRPFDPEAVRASARRALSRRASARRDPARRDPARRDPARRDPARRDPARRGRMPAPAPPPSRRSPGHADSADSPNSPGRPAPTPRAARRFVASSRRMADSLEARPPAPGSGGERDPGDILIDLLDFAEQITAFTPERAPAELTFPPLAEVVAATAERRAGGGPEG